MKIERIQINRLCIQVDNFTVEEFLPERKQIISITINNSYFPSIYRFCAPKNELPYVRLSPKYAMNGFFVLFKQK